MGRIVIHAPNTWLSVVGIHRCIDCKESWPCPGELRQRVDSRDVEAEKAMIDWQRRVLVFADLVRQQGLAP